MTALEIILLVSTLVTAGLCGFCVWGWAMESKRNKGIVREDEKMMRRARHRAVKLVREARDRAVEIINQAGELAAKDEQWLDAQVRKATEEKMGEYKTMLQKLYEDVRTQAEKEMDEFEAVLEKETVGTQQAVAARIEEDYALARKQVDEYKQLRMKKVDEVAIQIVGRVLEKAVGRAIPLAEHKKLLSESIEEARREHVF